MDIDYLILGSGYSGAFLRRHIESQETKSTISESSRIKDKKDFVFNLQDKETWSFLPKAKNTFLLFALESSKEKNPHKEESELAQNFFDLNKEKLGKLVICSSTGFFKTDFPDQEVTEETELDLTNKRAATEEKLRTKGAVIVHASGIYGPNRNPVDWLKTGKVSVSEKYVNLVHVEDLCQFLYKAALLSNPTDRYIASDNTPMRWQDISRKIEKDYKLEFSAQTNTPSNRLSKQIKNEKSIEKLDIRLKYPDVFSGVKALMKPTKA